MNNKKVLSLLLAVVMVFGAFGTVFASETNKSDANDAKIEWLKDNKVVEGRKVNENPEDNELDLDDEITRAEVTKLIVYTLGKQDLADTLDGVIKPFPDVDNSHWANGYISVAATQRTNKDNDNGIIIGYEDGEFKPERDVTYAELATMLVRIVKDDLTKEMEDKAIWATDYLRWAEEEGILDGIKVTNSNAAIDRYDAFVMIYNAFFELGETGVNQAKFGDQLGIVSRIGSGQVEINQDKVYKLNWNSYLSRGTGWDELGKNFNRSDVGALVRFTTNEDGEITHLIVLGQNGKAAEDYRWKGVADHAVPQGDAATATAKFSGQYFDTINVGGITAEIDDETRFFVADVNKNALKEVEDLNTIFKLYVNQANVYDKVYMGYDTYAGRNEAKVIVFGDVDKYQGLNEVRRVTKFLNSKEDFEAEDTKGVRTKYNIKKTTGFPASDYVDVNDVVRIRDGYWEKYPNPVIIDYSKDNVYKVEKLSEGNRVVRLKDEHGNQQEFYIKDTDIFTEQQFKEGVNVQIAVETKPVDDGTGAERLEVVKDTSGRYELEAISVVNKDLKGELEGGVYVGTNKGYLKELSERNDSTAFNYKYVARFARTSTGGAPINDYYITELDKDILDIYKTHITPEDSLGRELTFDVREEGLGKVAYNFQFSQDEWVKIAETALDRFEGKVDEVPGGQARDKEVAKHAIAKIVNDETARKTLQQRYNRLGAVNVETLVATNITGLKIDETRKLEVKNQVATRAGGTRLEDVPYSGLTFRSSDNAIASVDASGNVTGNSAGTATITVTGYGKTVDATVTVLSNDTNISSVTLLKDTTGGSLSKSYTVSADQFTLNPSSKRYEATLQLEDSDNIGMLTLENLSVAANASGADVVEKKIENNGQFYEFTVVAPDGDAKQVYRLNIKNPAQ